MKPAVELARLAIVWERAHGVFYPASAAEMAELASAVLADEDVRYFVSLDGKAITCAKCRQTSFNAHDVERRYCGFCHAFHDAAKP